MNGEVTYSLSSGSEDQYGNLFRVDSRSGVLSQLIPVDYEQLTETSRHPISLLVVARDNGHYSSVNNRLLLLALPPNLFLIYYRAMHYSAKRGLAITCRLSVCPSVTLVDHDHIG